jgi:hypothetical protein
MKEKEGGVEYPHLPLLNIHSEVYKRLSRGPYLIREVVWQSNLTLRQAAPPSAFASY